MQHVQQRIHISSSFVYVMSFIFNVTNSKEFTRISTRWRATFCFEKNSIFCYPEKISQRGGNFSGPATKQRVISRSCARVGKFTKWSRLLNARGNSERSIFVKESGTFSFLRVFFEKYHRRRTNQKARQRTAVVTRGKHTSEYT